MLKKLMGLFGGRPVVVKGTGALEDGHAKKIEIGDVLAGTGVELVLCRVGGELFALDAHCPHEGGRITEGPLADGVHAVCPLHNYRFDPRTGEPWRPLCRKAKTYRVREKDGDAELWL